MKRDDAVFVADFNHNPVSPTTLKLQKRAMESLTWYKVCFSIMLFITHLVCIINSCNMDSITFCAHGNLLITLAISPDLRIAGRALYFGILGAHLAPRIVVCFPTSG